MGLMCCLYEETRDPTYLEAAKRALTRANPNLKYGPKTSTRVMAVFADFEEDLTQETAVQLQTELMARKNYALIFVQNNMANTRTSYIDQLT
ncbi:uncharacterized protein PgNI_08405 [Pyricularia grisea]|uniref:Uncharacterized protein n=1 Tax=Pyricularia grisea TaxID=148305 RepID=A0A6P8AV91_PYRGI|nr:uncharacterized protein PgNI_08405 [Pyricularia grisea]TLD06132.1 hypothetical protein PgNI_08405 [Pyricularia grisea]